MVKKNLLENLHVNLQEEIFEDLLKNDKFTIERIVSHGQSSPEGYWYDQEENEFVVLLSGEAHLIFEGEDIPIELAKGDALLIPSRKKHRVDWTSPDEDTVWLTVHY